jgi:hypothetical protein
MAGGLNKKFKDNPVAFMKSHIIDVNVSNVMLIQVSNKNVDTSKATLARTGRLDPRDAKSSLNKAAGIYDFDLIKTAVKAEVEDTVHGKKSLSSIPVCELKAWGSKKRDQIRGLSGAMELVSTTYKKPHFAHPISAFWVPWDANTCWSVRLSDAADYFFTPTMDGCCLAISSDPNPVVSHGNYRNLMHPESADQARTMGQLIRHHGKLHANVGKSLQKDTYAATPEEKKESGINKLVTVIGVRDTVNGSWRFYWQRRRIQANKQGTANILLLDRSILL